jgi:hypothetical protein
MRMITFDKRTRVRNLRPLIVVLEDRLPFPQDGSCRSYDMTALLEGLEIFIVTESY